MATIEGSWWSITLELRGRSEKRVSTKGRTLAFELGPRRTTQLCHAGGQRATSKPGLPGVGRSDWFGKRFSGTGMWRGVPKRLERAHRGVPA